MNKFELILERFKRQEILFNKNPSRLILNKFINEIKDNSAQFQINIWRNHAIEPLINYLNIYTNNFNYHLKFEISNYDDSFSFNNISVSDLNIIWIDFERYDNDKFSDLNAWFLQRVKVLRERVKTPILVISLEQKKRIFKLIKEYFLDLPGVFLVDIASDIGNFNFPIYEKKYEKISGTCLNNKLHILVARKIACHWIPPLLFTPLKAIAIDLDNTLYSGVLGEDGHENLLITEEHFYFILF